MLSLCHDKGNNGSSTLPVMKREGKEKFILKEVVKMIENVVILMLALWLIFSFFIGIKMAPNDDMNPRISAGDILVYYRIDKNPNAQDVVILNKNKTDYVGRVIAGPGDKVEITNEDALMVNNNMVIESNIFYDTPMYEGFVKYPLTLAKNEYFILSDKREGGEDSRYYGPIKTDEIKGVIIGQFRKDRI